MPRSASTTRSGSTGSRRATSATASGDTPVPPPADIAPPADATPRSRRAKTAASNETSSSTTTEQTRGGVSKRARRVVLEDEADEAPAPIRDAPPVAEPASVESTDQRSTDTKGIDLDERRLLITEVAYRRYVARGYVDGYDLDDWLGAEEEVDRFLQEAKGSA